VAFRVLGPALTLALAVPGQAASQDHPPIPHRHPDAQKLESPSAATPESVKAGAGLYAKHCAPCHGPNGLGNGRLAAGMAAYGARPSDLTDDTWQHGGSEGEIFTLIRDGLGSDSQMPAYATRLSDSDIWQVVQFVRSLSGPAK
jgi:mono/diheme cytochrome c family protein